MKLNDWYVKLDLTIWIAADFECMNIPIEDPQRKTLYLNELVEVRCNTVKTPNYKKLNLRVDGLNKYLEDDCVEWFVNEILESGICMKPCFVF